VGECGGDGDLVFVVAVVFGLLDGEGLWVEEWFDCFDCVLCVSEEAV
jgi:hypothetical protein